MRKSVCIIEMGLLLFFALVFSAATGLERQQQRISDSMIRLLGASDRATVTLKRELFGTRYYDRFTLPGGYYEALRVTIGEGDGKNWWCVVYPQLCLSAATERDVVPAMGSLSKDDAELLEDGELRFRFRCLELLENLLGYFRDTGEGIPASE